MTILSNTVRTCMILMVVGTSVTALDTCLASGGGDSGPSLCAALLEASSQQRQYPYVATFGTGFISFDFSASIGSEFILFVMSPTFVANTDPLALADSQLGFTSPLCVLNGVAYTGPFTFDAPFRASFFGVTPPTMINSITQGTGTSTCTVGSFNQSTGGGGARFARKR